MSLTSTVRVQQVVTIAMFVAMLIFVLTMRQQCGAGMGAFLDGLQMADGGAGRGAEGPDAGAGRSAASGGGPTAN